MKKTTEEEQIKVLRVLDLAECFVEVSEKNISKEILEHSEEVKNITLGMLNNVKKDIKEVEELLKRELII